MKKIKVNKLIDGFTAIKLSAIPGYKDLTKGQQEILEKTYRRHRSAMGSEMKDKYSIQDIKRVRWDANKNVAIIEFTNGEWWHYDHDGTWY